MALMGQDGETHSHLKANEDAARIPGAGHPAHAQMPDRGHWVGPRPGEPVIDRNRSVLLEKGEYLDCRPGDPLPLEKPESTLPSMPHGYAVMEARRIAHRTIQLLLEHQPMIAEQRRILVQALGVLETLS